MPISHIDVDLSVWADLLWRAEAFIRLVDGEGAFTTAEASGRTDIREMSTVLSLLLRLMPMCQPSSREWIGHALEWLKKECQEHHSVVALDDIPNGTASELLGSPKAGDITGFNQSGFTCVGVSNDGYTTWEYDLAKSISWEEDLVILYRLGRAQTYSYYAIQELQLAVGHYDGWIEWLKTCTDRIPQDPMVSAPKLVEEVAGVLAIPTESARYYLQLLALDEPTDRNIQTWNKWKKAERLEAVAPLLEKGLIIESKRTRAARSHFIPGGWLAATSPVRPMEEWKIPLFDVIQAGRVVPVVEDLVLPSLPYPQLFQQAWERFVTGDKPQPLDANDEQ